MNYHLPKEKTTFQSLYLILIFLSTALLSACVSSYKPIQIKEIQFEEEAKLAQVGEVIIRWKYNQFADSGNELYAAQETSALLSKVCLLVLQIQNKGDQPITFPDDVEIFAGRKLKKPLSKKKAFQLLKIDANEESDNVVEEIFQGLSALNCWASNKEFKKDIYAYYLNSRIIPPSETVIGLLALRVKPETKLAFIKRLK